MEENSQKESGQLHPSPKTLMDSLDSEIVLNKEFQTSKIEENSCSAVLGTKQNGTSDINQSESQSSCIICTGCRDSVTLCNIDDHLRFYHPMFIYAVKLDQPSERKLECQQKVLWCTKCSLEVSDISTHNEEYHESEQGTTKNQPTNPVSREMFSSQQACHSTFQQEVNAEKDDYCEIGCSKPEVTKMESTDLEQNVSKKDSSEQDTKEAYSAPQVSLTGSSEPKVSGKDSCEPDVSQNMPSQTETINKEMFKPDVSKKVFSIPRVLKAGSIQPEPVKEISSGTKFSQEVSSRLEAFANDIKYDNGQSRGPGVNNEKCMETEVSNKTSTIPEVSRKESSQPECSTKGSVQPEDSNRGSRVHKIPINDNSSEPGVAQKVFNIESNNTHVSNKHTNELKVSKTEFSKLEFSLKEPNELDFPTNDCKKQQFFKLETFKHAVFSKLPKNDYHEKESNKPPIWKPVVSKNEHNTLCFSKKNACDPDVSRKESNEPVVSKMECYKTGLSTNTLGKPGVFIEENFDPDVSKKEFIDLKPNASKVESSEPNMSESECKKSDIFEIEPSKPDVSRTEVIEAETTKQEQSGPDISSKNDLVSVSLDHNYCKVISVEHGSHMKCSSGEQKTAQQDVSYDDNNGHGCTNVIFSDAKNTSEFEVLNKVIHNTEKCGNRYNKQTSGTWHTMDSYFNNEGKSCSGTLQESGSHSKVIGVGEPSDGLENHSDESPDEDVSGLSDSNSIPAESDDESETDTAPSDNDCEKPPDTAFCSVFDQSAQPKPVKLFINPSRLAEIKKAHNYRAQQSTKGNVAKKSTTQKRKVYSEKKQIVFVSSEDQNRVIECSSVNSPLSLCPGTSRMLTTERSPEPKPLRYIVCYRGGPSSPQSPVQGMTKDKYLVGPSGLKLSPGIPASIMNLKSVTENAKLVTTTQKPQQSRAVVIPSTGSTLQSSQSRIVTVQPRTTSLQPSQSRAEITSQPITSIQPSPSRVVLVPQTVTALKPIVIAPIQDTCFSPNSTQLPESVSQIHSSAMSVIDPVNVDSSSLEPVKVKTEPIDFGYLDSGALFVCDDCGACFNSAVKLTEHSQVHSMGTDYSYDDIKLGMSKKARSKWAKESSWSKSIGVIKTESPSRDSVYKNLSCVWATGIKKKPPLQKEEAIPVPVRNGEVDTDLLSKRARLDMQRQFPCPYCGKRFVSKINVKRHADVLHLGITRFKCRICDRPTPCRSELARHETTHKSWEWAALAARENAKQTEEGTEEI